MATVRPFKGFRPPKRYAELIASRPYDVLNSEEARAEAGENEMSLYHIIKPEIDFEYGIREYAPQVYEKAAENFTKFKQKGWFVQDEKESYYIYAQERNGKKQYGLVVAASIADYQNGVIKKHEHTRYDKEEDRMKHIRICNAHIEPVFFAYPDNKRLDALIARYTNTAPEYDFIAPLDGFRHQFWIVSSSEDIELITNEFAQIPSLYIADGHHRSAAAASVGTEKAKQNPNHKGDEEYNYFMAVCFQASQLTILEYNRVVRDLNGYTTEEFITALKVNFNIEQKGKSIYRPTRVHEFSLYIDEQWYCLKAKEGTFDNNDPIGILDVEISSRLILDDILGIRDLRNDKRIDFIGGIRGLEELERVVNSGEMRMALALYPVTMQQIIEVAESGNSMPPKATWFEPKLRSGLIIHQLP